MIAFWTIATVCAVLQGSEAGPATRIEDRLVFTDRGRESEDFDHRIVKRQNSDGGSNIENVFKIPIAVIKGTSAVAQAFYPESTDTINKIFDIPVMTLDAVGNYIKERPQRLGANDGNDRLEQRPVRFSQQRPNRRRDERRERLTKIREQEREERDRRRSMKQREKILHGGHSSIGLDSVASAFTDLFGGGGHGHHHAHGHQGFFEKPHKRPSKPTRPTIPHKPDKPEQQGGNNGYEVYEQIDESPVHVSGLFSWLQTSTQSDYPRIQNKIAPGFDFQNDRDVAEFRGF